MTVRSFGTNVPSWVCHASVTDGCGKEIMLLIMLVIEESKSSYYPLLQELYMVLRIDSNAARSPSVTSLSTCLLVAYIGNTYKSSHIKFILKVYRCQRSP